MDRGTQHLDSSVGGIGRASCDSVLQQSSWRAQPNANEWDASPPCGGFDQSGTRRSSSHQTSNVPPLILHKLFKQPNVIRPLASAAGGAMSGVFFAG